MFDLLYGGNQYKKELLGLFPLAEIHDASDEIHEGRISIQVDIEPKEYRRIMFLNGYSEISLSVMLWLMEHKNKAEIMNHIKEWKRNYPEYFKEPING